MGRARKAQAWPVRACSGWPEANIFVENRRKSLLAAQWAAISEAMHHLPGLDTCPTGREPGFRRLCYKDDGPLGRYR